MERSIGPPPVAVRTLYLFLGETLYDTFPESLGRPILQKS